jgi:hypothetical protein
MNMPLFGAIVVGRHAGLIGCATYSSPLAGAMMVMTGALECYAGKR